MALSLSNLQKPKSATKKRKRVGRGNASGHGTYSTRGLKGQKSRSGVSGLKRLGMKKQLLAIPKTRGFNSRHAKDEVVSLRALNKAFSDGALINPKTLFAARLISSPNSSVKILNTGELKLQNLKFVDVNASAEAKNKIAAQKGTFGK